MKEKVTIRVCGQSLSVTVDQQEKESLMRAAQKVDKICRSMPSKDPKIQLLSAALTYAIELEKKEKEEHALSARIDSIIGRCDEILKK